MFSLYSLIDQVPKVWVAFGVVTRERLLFCAQGATPNTHGLILCFSRLFIWPFPPLPCCLYFVCASPIRYDHPPEAKRSTKLQTWQIRHLEHGKVYFCNRNGHMDGRSFIPINGKRILQITGESLVTHSTLMISQV
jgi:hypothetical protein